MKYIATALGLASLFSSQLLMADYIIGGSYGLRGLALSNDLYVSQDGSYATTDEVEDETTVKATLYHNLLKLRWEFKLEPALNPGGSLTETHDINTASSLRIVAQIFDETHPQTLNSAKVMGDLDSFKYDETFDTATFQGSPIDLTPSATYPSGKPGVFATYLSYAGNSADHPEGEIDYGNAIIESNVWIDDLGYLMHPSSHSLWGSGFSVNGVAGTEADINLYSQKSYAEWAFGGKSAAGAEGFIDGYKPNQDFDFSVSMMPQENFSLTTQPQENNDDDDVMRYNIQLRYQFSTRDFQIGYFNNPWLGSFLGEAGWQYLNWFGWFNPVSQGWVFHDELGWVYAPESSTYDNLFLYIQSLGWVFTNMDLFPYMYVFDYQGNAFWAYYYRGTKNPNVFYNFDTDSAIFIP